jgi:hypothetical protein
MSVSSWLLDYDARYEGDPQRQRLLGVAREAGPYLRSNPAQALALYEQGRRLAETLHEPWWVMYFTHWKLQVLLNTRPDLVEAQRLAVQATLEVRKPVYEGLPQRVCLHDDLVNTYLGADPAGHAAAISEALAFMEADVAPGMECRYCIQGDFADFHLGISDLAGAEAACMRILAMAEDEPAATTRAHHGMTALSRLCEIAFLRQDWAALGRSAAWGEALHQEVPRPQLLAEFLQWQALLVRRDGDTRRAARLSRRAESTVAASGAVPRTAYFDALCAYHLAGEDAGKALASRERELALIAGSGMRQREAHCRLERCRLLARLGLPLQEALEEAGSAARQLRRPEALLAELEQIGG